MGFVDLDLAHPGVKRRVGDPEVGSDLGDRLLTQLGQLDRLCTDRLLTASASHG